MEGGDRLRVHQEEMAEWRGVRLVAVAMFCFSFVIYVRNFFRVSWK